MPALVPTDLTGTITWLGRTGPRLTPEIDGHAVERLDLTFAGPEGDAHAGLTRPSCSRVTTQYPRGTEIRNVRQLSLLCAEELAAIARAMGIDGLDPAWLGASVVISGLPDFSHLPPGARLQAGNGTTLTVDMINLPCQLPAMTITRELDDRGKGFRAAAKGRRGVTAWVEREGSLAVGETLRLHIPGQRPWRGPGLL